MKSFIDFIFEIETKDFLLITKAGRQKKITKKYWKEKQKDLTKIGWKLYALPKSYGWERVGN